MTKVKIKKQAEHGWGYRIKLIFIGLFVIYWIVDQLYVFLIYDYLMALAGIYWLGVSRSARVGPKLTFLLAFLSYLYASFNQFYGNYVSTEKAASWFWLLLCLGLAQLLIDRHHEPFTT